MSQNYRSKGELQFYLVISILGLLLIVAAFVFRGVPQTIIGWEMIGFGALFFIGTLIWAIRNLSRGRYSSQQSPKGPGGV